MSRSNMLRNGSVLAVSLVAATAAGCALRSSNRDPVPIVDEVDLSRYMGTWFVIGAIGLGVEDGAHNAVEIYRPRPDGSIDTVFRFRADAFDGPLETRKTLAWVVDGTRNAEWRVRLFWPFRHQYVVSFLEPDYSVAIVARDARDHVWLLARGPEMDDERFQGYRRMIERMGYDMRAFRRYPQNGERPEEPMETRVGDQDVPTRSAAGV